MVKKYALQRIFSKDNTTIFISEQVTQSARIVISDISSGQNTHIELDQFYEHFDGYRALLLKRAKLKKKRALFPLPAKMAYKLIQDIEETYVQEKQMRIDILELALLLEKIDDSERIQQLRHDFKAGRLTKMNQSLPADLLALKRQELTETEQKLDQIEQKLVDNASEFLIKAQLTNLTSQDRNRFHQSVHFFEQGFISARAAGRKLHLVLYSHSYGLFLQQHQQFAQAKERYLECLEWIDPTAEGLKEETAAVLTNLGAIYRESYQFNESITAYRQALKIYQQPHRSDGRVAKLSVASVLNNLGITYADGKDFRKADQCYQQALTSLKAAEPSDAYLPEIAMTLNNQGNLKAERNDYSGALTLLDQALQIRRSLARNDWERFGGTVAMTLTNRGVLQQENHQFREAEQSFNEAYKLYQKLALRSPEMYLPDQAMVGYNLGLLLSDMNEPLRSEHMLQQACDQYRQLCTGNRYYFIPFALTLQVLGTTQTQLHKFGQAEESYQQAVSIIRHVGAGTSTLLQADLARTLTNLGDLYRLWEDERSLGCYQQAKTIWVTLNRQYPLGFQSDFATTLSNMALLYYEHGKFSQASALFSQALKIKKKLADTHPDVYLPGLADTLNNVSILYMDTGKLRQAVTGFQQAAEIYKHVRTGHKRAFLADFAMTIHNQAIAESRLGFYKNAEIHYQSALTIYQRLAKKIPETILADVAMSALNLAELYQQHGMLKQARRMIRIGLQAIADFQPVELLTSWLRMAIELLKNCGEQPVNFLERTFGATCQLVLAAKQHRLLSGSNRVVSAG